MRIDVSTLSKRYYTISEVSEMFDVTKSLLRYWEGEFKDIQPRKDRGGIRRYTVKDIEVLNKIYDLVKKRGFTIEGARKELSIKEEDRATTPVKLKLQNVLARLKELRGQLPD